MVSLLETSDGWRCDSANIREFENYLFETEYSDGPLATARLVRMRNEFKDAKSVQNLKMSDAWWADYKKRYGNRADKVALISTESVSTESTNTSTANQDDLANLQTSLTADQEKEIYLFRIQNPVMSLTELAKKFSDKYQVWVISTVPTSYTYNGQH